MSQPREVFVTPRHVAAAVTVFAWCVGVVTVVAWIAPAAVTSSGGALQAGMASGVDEPEMNAGDAGEERDDARVLDAQGTADTSGFRVLSSGSMETDVWVAQLASIEVSDGRRTLERRWRRIRRDVPEAQVLRSADFGSLRPGYWVVFEPGPFRSGPEAVAFCESVGRYSKRACLGRYLSEHRSDRGRLCFRNQMGQFVATCD